MKLLELEIMGVIFSAFTLTYFFFFAPVFPAFDVGNMLVSMLI